MHINRSLILFSSSAHLIASLVLSLGTLILFFIFYFSYPAPWTRRGHEVGFEYLHVHAAMLGYGPFVSSLVLSLPSIFGFFPHGQLQNGIVLPVPRLPAPSSRALPGLPSVAISPWGSSTLDHGQEVPGIIRILLRRRNHEVSFWLSFFFFF